MPWRKVVPVDEQRMRFVLDVERTGFQVSELCEVHGISRKTGYKWLGRYREEGREGLNDRSRRPHSCPHETSQEWKDRIITEKTRDDDHRRWGPKKIYAELKERYCSYHIPASSTIGEILKRQGLVKPRKRRRRRQRIYGESLTEPQRPNHVWAVDYKGHFRTQDGLRCDPLTVSDLYSRYVLEVRALPDESYIFARPAFEAVFKEYGLPEIIRSDNGPPFGSTGAGGLSRLSVWWILLGIEPEFITRGHPEENAIHERMHWTLKQEACKSASSNLRAQQRRFGKWRRSFNEARPHEGIGMKKPAQVYMPSGVRYYGRLVEPIYGPDYAIRSVRSDGRIKWCGRQRFVGEAFIGWHVGLKRIDEDRSQVYFGSFLLGDLFDNDQGGIRPSIIIPGKGKR
jgi:putative transposase